MLKITRQTRKYNFVWPDYWKITTTDAGLPADVGYLDHATGPNHQPMPGWEIDMYYPYNTVEDEITYLPAELSEDEAAKEALGIAQEILEKYRKVTSDGGTN